MGFFDFLKNKIGIVGCGWIGTPLAKKMLESDYIVFGTTTRIEKKQELVNLGITEVTVGKFELNWQGEELHWLKELDYLIIDFPPSKNIDEYAHATQIESLIQLLSNSTKVIYTSSTSIYQENGKEVFESDILEDATAASLKIYHAEKKLKTLLGNRVTILRCGGLSGWTRNLAKFFAGKTNVEGANVPINLVHGEDVIRAIEHVIKKDSFGKIYNIVAPMHPTKEVFYTDLCEKSNMPLPQFNAIVQDQKFKIVNSDLFQKETGFEYKYPNPAFFTYI